MKAGLRGRAWARDNPGERGSATIAVVGMIALAVALMGFVGGIAAVEGARAQAQTAADFAALGAAQVTLGQGNGSPCDVAGQAAAHVGARVDSCTREDFDVRVTVSLPVTAAGSVWQVHARARAGPDLP